MVIHMYPRYLQKRLEAALADTPVVLLTGARQTGKSTLAQAYAAAKGAVYVTFDDPNVLAAAKDTVGFIKSLGERAVIDEVQRAPWLFTAVKLTVDRNRRPGRFLFTGSANVLLVPQVSDSLAGRMEILQLWPLSQGEIYGRKERFIDVLFGNHDWSLRPQEPQDDDIPELLVRGGYPEMIGRVESTRREAWLVAYLRTLIERDVRDLANIEGLVEMPRLLALLAARTGALMNLAEVSRAVGIPHTTLKRYLTLLQATFILTPLPGWSGNLGKRLIKAPKVHFPDSAMAAYLARYDAQRLAEDRGFLGHLLETFAVAELRKQAGWAKHNVDFYYYRTSTGQEVDIVMEDRRGRLAGIEIKASATLDTKDFAGLKAFADTAGKRFVGGILLYTGSDVLPFGKKLYAMPVSALWRVS
ncbi:MAG TPA: ATP-binding protein [Acidiferrobacterales bacterium]|nr:ATP-binding protein [Acidiferrobacterales bacterium]